MDLKKRMAELIRFDAEVEKFNQQKTIPTASKMQEIRQKVEQLQPLVRGEIEKKPNSVAEILQGTEYPSAGQTRATRDALLRELQQAEAEHEEALRQLSILGKEREAMQRSYLADVASVYSRLLENEVAKNRKTLDRLFALARLAGHRAGGNTMEIPGCGSTLAADLMRGLLRHGYELENIDCASIATEVEPKR